LGQLRNPRRGDGEAGLKRWEWLLAIALGSAFLLAAAWRVGLTIGL
jgi:hypothetical protein